MDIRVPTTYQVQSPIDLLKRNAKVQHPTNLEIGSWDRDLVYQIFTNDEANAIWNILINKHGAADKIIWWPAKSGNFSIKSTYHLELDRSKRIQWEQSSKGTNDPKWKVLWKLKVLFVKNFIWRAFHDILPTRMNLFRRKTSYQSRCLSVKKRTKL